MSNLVKSVILTNKYHITIPKNHSIVRVSHYTAKEHAALSKSIVLSLVKEQQHYTSVIVQWPDKIKFKLVVDTTPYNDENMSTMLGMLHYDRYIYQMNSKVELVKQTKALSDAED